MEAAREIQGNIESTATELYGLLDIKDRKYHLQTYKKCFVGKDCVDIMIKKQFANTIQDAVALGNLMLHAGIIEHVMQDHGFENAHYYYHFIKDKPDHGSKSFLPSIDNMAVSWQHLSEGYLPVGSTEKRTKDMGGDILLQGHLETDSRDTGMINETAAMEIGMSPLDEHNVKLLDNVHPALWNDPPGADVYNLVVLGAGAGGLVSAAGSAAVFAKVAIIEEHLMGGDCLNFGCVPSKALIASAKMVHRLKKSAILGVDIEGTVKVDFRKVMERMRKLRADISRHDSAERFSKTLEVDVYLGHGIFTSPSTVQINDKTLKFKKAVIATGGSPVLPAIPGLKEAPYLTNYSIFNLTNLPPRMSVIGAGPIGLELAQAMARFGTEVTILVRDTKIMPKEDADASTIVIESMRKDGIEVVFGVKFISVEHDKARPMTCSTEIESNFPTIRVITEVEGQNRTFTTETLLVATGRRPNVSGLALETAGINSDDKEGIIVNDKLQTTNDNVYAVGDCCTRYQFTHMADFMARIVIRNALFYGNARVSTLLVPWCTFTEPEVAHVGLYPHDLNDQNIAYSTFIKHFSGVDRAILEGETDGFVKIHVKAGTDTIVGATIVGACAGDMISEISVAMQHGVGLGKLASVIHPYPTNAEAIKQCGDLYSKTRLTAVVKGLFRGLMSWQRR
eukprot:515273_1